MRTRFSRGLRSRKCRASAQAEGFGLADRLARGQRIHRVLHRVGRQHVAVVAVGVRCVVVALRSGSRRSGRAGRDDRGRAAPARAGRATCRRLIERACRAPNTTTAGEPAIIAPRLSRRSPTSRRRASAAAPSPTNDDFFAPMSNLVKAEPAVFIPGKFTPRGKWMDGWESRRRRTPGHDWCVVALGHARRGPRRRRRHQLLHRQLPVALFDRRARHDARASGPALAARRTGRRGRSLLAKSPLRGNSHNYLGSPSSDDAAVDARAAEHLSRRRRRAAARLRRRRGRLDAACARPGAPIDLAAIRNGGLVLGASDMHFGAKDNMIMPGRATNMGDGWETRRRRGPGHDWAIVRLGRAGTVTRDRDRHQPLQGQLSRQRVARRLPRARRRARRRSRPAAWRELLPQTKLQAHHRHFFAKRAAATGPRLARAAQHLPGRRRQPAACPWNRGSGLIARRAETRRAQLLRTCCGSTRVGRADARAPAVRQHRARCSTAARDEWFALTPDRLAARRSAITRRSATATSLRAPLRGDTRICRSSEQARRGRRRADACSTRSPTAIARYRGQVRLHLHRLRDRPERRRDAGAASRAPAERSGDRDPDRGGGAGEDHGAATAEPGGNPSGDAAPRTVTAGRLEWRPGLIANARDHRRSRRSGASILVSS